MRSAIVLLATGLLCAPLSCVDLDAPFVCTTNDECVWSGANGICEATHACSFSDSACASGHRYGPLSASALANQCLSDFDAGVDLADLSSATDVVEVAHLVAPQSGGTGAVVLVADGSTDMAAGPATIDTTNLLIDGVQPPAGVTFEIVHEVATGSEFAVLRLRSLSIGGGKNVTVRGARGLVVVATGDITVSGILDASAVHSTPGPGGGFSGTGAGSGMAASAYGTGSGGAGYGAKGGDGANYSGAAAMGGAPYGDAAISTLVGGSGGGPDFDGRAGGAGGGIVQLSSATRIVIGPTGGINAGGGGAPLAPAYNLQYDGGSGGGSGGTIFLQAPIVTIAGTVAANGGGGRGDTALGDAQDGHLSSAAAAGGFGQNGKVAGGNGGAKNAEAGPGKTVGPGSGSGGGGAVGRISVLYTQTYNALGLTSPTEHASRAQ